MIAYSTNKKKFNTSSKHINYNIKTTHLCYKHVNTFMLNRYVMGNRLNKKHVHTEILSI